jgi:hypothetical protein
MKYPRFTYKYGAVLKPLRCLGQIDVIRCMSTGRLSYLQSFNIPDISPNTQSSKNDGWRGQMYHMPDSRGCFHPVSVLKFNCVLDLSAYAPQSPAY